MDVTRPYRTTMIFQTRETPLMAAEIEATPKHLMDCVDCHNRAGHPFSSPRQLSTAPWRWAISSVSCDTSGPVQ